MSALTTVGRDLYIQFNDNLMDISGLSALTSFNGDMLINSNAALCQADVDALVRQLLTLEPAPSVFDVTTGNTGACPLRCDRGTFVGDASGSMSELEGYTSIRGSLYIESNLNDLSALRCLERIEVDSQRTPPTGLLSIRNTTALTDLSGLERLTTVDGILRIEDNNVLRDLSGLLALTSVGNISIDDNAALCQDDVDALLARLGRTAQSVNNNGACGRCDRGAFSGEVTSLGGLDGHTSVTGDLYIQGTSLTNLSLLHCLERVEGSLVIGGNAGLRDLSGLSGLTTVGGLVINDNDALTDLSGLSGLTTVGYLSITLNDALEDLSGLSGLTTVGVGLEIRFNNVLGDISALSGLSACAGNMYIDYNAALCQDDVDALVMQLLTLEPAPTVSDVTTGNDGACP
jgi:hypothetical protein